MQGIGGVRDEYDRRRLLSEEPEVRESIRLIQYNQKVDLAPCQFQQIISWGGALCEAIALASILISIARFGWTKLGEGQPV